jgi:hypothetical protein
MELIAPMALALLLLMYQRLNWSNTPVELKLWNGVGRRLLVGVLHADGLVSMSTSCPREFNAVMRTRSVERFIPLLP